MIGDIVEYHDGIDIKKNVLLAMYDIPSGKRLQFAIENGPVKIVDLPMKIAWWIFPSFFG